MDRAEQSFYQESPPLGVLERVRRRLFPMASLPPVPADETRSFLTTRVAVVVDWPDRLRMLVRGRATVQVRTYTDVEVREAASVSTFSVE